MRRSKYHSNNTTKPMLKVMRQDLCFQTLFIHDQVLVLLQIQIKAFSMELAPTNHLFLLFVLLPSVGHSVFCFRFSSLLVIFFILLLPYPLVSHLGSFRPLFFRRLLSISFILSVSPPLSFLGWAILLGFLFCRASLVPHFLPFLSIIFDFFLQLLVLLFPLFSADPGFVLQLLPLLFQLLLPLIQSLLLLLHHYCSSFKCHSLSILPLAIIFRLWSLLFLLFTVGSSLFFIFLLSLSRLFFIAPRFFFLASVRLPILPFLLPLTAFSFLLRFSFPHFQISIFVIFLLLPQMFSLGFSLFGRSFKPVRSIPLLGVTFRLFRLHFLYFRF